VLTAGGAIGLKGIHTV